MTADANGHAVAPPGSSRRRVRRGSALVLVLIAIVVLAVLSTGAILGSMQELRAAHNEQMAQRALAVAEYGLNRQLANWTTARNQMANGAIETDVVSSADGDTATVQVMRLNRRTFQIVSVGRTNRSNGRLEAQRQVSLLVNLSSATKTVPATLTTHLNTTVKGSAYITGRNTDPAGWLGCVPANDTFAIAINPTATLSVQKPATQAINGTYQDPNAGNSTFFTTFGTESFASLAAAASITLTATSPNPKPSGGLTVCNYGSTNWGEPFRLVGAVVGCQAYFPTVYAPGDLQINGNSRGQGVLLVEGDLTVNGTFTYAGLIVVKGNLKANGNFSLYGAALVQGTADATSGNASFFYSACALSSAFSGLAKPSRTRQRAWAQLYL